MKDMTRNKLYTSYLMSEAICCEEDGGMLYEQAFYDDIDTLYIVSKEKFITEINYLIN